MEPFTLLKLESLPLELIPVVTRNSPKRKIADLCHGDYSSLGIGIFHPEQNQIQDDISYKTASRLEENATRRTFRQGIKC